MRAKVRMYGYNYNIIVAGHLPDAWVSRFQGFGLKRLWTGRSRISGRAVDESAMFGVLTVLQDMGVSVLKIKRRTVYLSRPEGLHRKVT